MRQIIDILLKMLLFAGGLCSGYQLSVFSEETKCIIADNSTQKASRLPQGLPEAKAEPWFPPNNEVKWTGASQQASPIGLLRIKDESRQENHLIQILPRYQNGNNLSGWISVRHNQSASVRLPAGVYRAIIHSWDRYDNYASTPEQALKTTPSFTVTSNNQRAIALYGRGGAYITPLPEITPPLPDKAKPPVDQDTDVENVPA